MKEIKEKIVNALRDFFNKAGFTKAVLGLSGGMDSALVFALGVEVLGKENVLPVLLPSIYSTSHSVSDSLEMIANLGTDHTVIPIKDVYDASLRTLAPIFGDAPFDVTEENLQARIRGMLLMAISNKQRRLLLNTSNKSELCAGYGTLYGDLCGSISVIGDLYKTEVYELAKYINSEKHVIPDNIINKPPSAELHFGQKDSDALPDYPILDPILRAYVDEKKDLNAIIDMGFDKKTVGRVIQLVNSAKFKASQLPPKIII
ncbi:MAG: NAD(+) synthase [Bacteroidales bacterium]|nr:NAD(+) synthase [Bacteroidales bacterium]